jgi:competence CoiA-like predicted nuclease
LRRFLQNEKRRRALETYIEELKKKAKITVNEELLSKA